jgi:DNA-binding transcriptional regulator YiaG
VSRATRLLRFGFGFSAVQGRTERVEVCAQRYVHARPAMARTSTLQAAGYLIERMRNEARMSQAGLAKALGTTQSSVSRWEAGTLRDEAPMAELWLVANGVM